MNKRRVRPLAAGAHEYRGDYPAGGQHCGHCVPVRLRQRDEVQRTRGRKAVGDADHDSAAKPADAPFHAEIGAPERATCEHCGSSETARVMSRVAVLRSGDGEGGDFDESSLADVDENDPRSMARWVRKMSRQMGEPLDAEMEAEIERMEAGEMPDDFGGEGEDEFAGLD
jgi:hypothetical protein